MRECRGAGEEGGWRASGRSHRDMTVSVPDRHPEEEALVHSLVVVEPHTRLAVGEVVVDSPPALHRLCLRHARSPPGVLGP